MAQGKEQALDTFGRHTGDRGGENWRDVQYLQEITGLPDMHLECSWIRQPIWLITVVKPKDLNGGPQDV